MEYPHKTIWFKRKRYGWGWTPCTWQGWLVLLGWLIIFYLIMHYVNQNIVLHLLLTTLSVIVLIVICYLKGEPPKWQWGREKENKDPTTLTQ